MLSAAKVDEEARSAEDRRRYREWKKQQATAARKLDKVQQ